MDQRAQVPPSDRYFTPTGGHYLGECPPVITLKYSLGRVYVDVRGLFFENNVIILTNQMILKIKSTLKTRKKPTITMNVGDIFNFLVTGELDVIILVQ